MIMYFSEGAPYMGEAIALLGVVQGVVGLLYWGGAAGCLYLAFRRPKTAWRKAAYVAAVVVVFAAWPAYSGFKALEVKRYRQTAWAHFQKRCVNDAGEKIYKSVRNIAGLLLLKPRQRATDAELRDQFWRGDPYGHDSILPDSEIRNFIGYLNDRNVATTRTTSQSGYSYVETKDGSGGYTRYELDTTQGKISGTAVAKPVSRYGMTWDDISTEEDRKYWVAGGKLKVLDLVTGEILGERVGYIIEPGFGAHGGGRVPWGHARYMSSDRAACPPFRPKSLLPINRLFVEKVLVPTGRGGDGK